MVRMIIADDEPVIVSGIQKLVDWDQLGISVAAVFDNGSDAYKYIIEHSPEIALLDISMPGKTGLKILEDVHMLGIMTHIIFITGYEDFDFVKQAISNGAIDYLLKPINKEVLIKAVNKCLMAYGKIQDQGESNSFPLSQSMLPSGLLNKLVMDQEEVYWPVIVVMPDLFQANDYEIQLGHFAVFSFLEGYLESSNLGIVFYKDKTIVMVIKGVQKTDIYTVLEAIVRKIASENNQYVGMVLGTVCIQMRDIPKQFQVCAVKKDMFFFVEHKKTPIITCDYQIMGCSVMESDIYLVENKLFETIMHLNEPEMTWYLERISKMIVGVSDGNPLQACFHYHSLLRTINEHFQSMKISIVMPNMSDILKKSQNLGHFTELANFYADLFNDYMHQIKQLTKDSNQQEIIKIKQFIEAHYEETLSLEVVAEQVHMNPYYFSGYFKKQTGENFKDYLNSIRMQQGMRLLMTTDLKNYEIADRVGFPDVRSFNKLFRKTYGELPLEFRKRAKIKE